MRHRLTGVFATFAVAVAAQTSSPSVAQTQSAAGRPDLMGVWKMDTTKLAKRDPELVALTLTVGQRGDTLVITTDVQDLNKPPFQMHARYVPLASVRLVDPADTSVHVSPLTWEGDTLVLRNVEQRPGRTLQIEERWTLDASGRILSRYQSVVDGKHLSRQILVFTRQ